jgi:DNA-binding CsgD family transcriptional regulator
MSIQKGFPESPLEIASVVCPRPAALRMRVIEADRSILGVTFSLGRLTELTASELEVARLARANHSNAAIAALRGSSARTVANQMASVFDKLGVGSRCALVMIGELGA